MVSQDFVLGYPSAAFQAGISGCVVLSSTCSPGLLSAAFQADVRRRLISFWLKANS
jgi:hypothetical protein